MRDTELYRQLLGLESPWEVGRVELSTDEGRVDVFAEHARGTRWPCPECGLVLPTYDHAEERAWRHLDSCGFSTHLHARPPRVECPEHGVRQVTLPWAEPMSRFTVLFERLAIDVLNACNVTRAGQLLRTSWDETWHLMERAVARGRAAKPEIVPAHLGVDEKSAGRGQDYITVVSDVDRGTVEYLADERRQASLDGYFEQFGPEQLARIEGVAMDMWEPFANSVRAHLADADNKIVFDKFHIMKHMVDAVDTVRKAENRALMKDGDKALSGTRYLWLYSAEHLPERHQERFDVLRRGDPQDEPGLGHQGEPAVLLGLPAQRLGREALEELVLLGHPLTAHPGDRGGTHLQATSVRSARLLRPPDHERGCRRTQCTHPGHPRLSTRLSQPRTFQDRHLLPSRWA